MASHRRIRHRPRAVGRGLLLRGRDVLILAICASCLLTAWLAYGTAGAYGTTTNDAGSANETRSGVPFPTASAPVITPPTAPPAAVGTPEPPASAQPMAEQGVAPLPVSSAPLRITYPKAGMDVVVHPLEPHADSQSIEPPVTMDGYWLTPFGLPGAGSTDTTYIIGHSWLDRDAPFNHLSSAAAAGDEFGVVTATGTMTYRVDSVTTYTKATLKDSPIWAVVPNRLVLISCYTEDPWGTNVTVMASPVAGR